MISCCVARCHTITIGLMAPMGVLPSNHRHRSPWDALRTVGRDDALPGARGPLGLKRLPCDEEQEE